MISKLRQDGGSLAPIGIFGAALILLTIAVTVNSRQAFIQQRQLNAISDALALDLADFARVKEGVDLLSWSSRQVSDFALNELESLTTETQPIDLTSVTAESKFAGIAVKVRLCQKPDSIFNLSGLFGSPAANVCAQSSAVSNSDFWQK